MSVPSSIKVPVKAIKTSGALNLVQRGPIDEGVGLGWTTRKRIALDDNFFGNLSSQTADEFLYSYQTTRDEATRYDFKKSV